jgi:hypothetical protein
VIIQTEFGALKAKCIRHTLLEQPNNYGNFGIVWWLRDG